MALFKKGAKEAPDPSPVRIDPTYGDPVGRRARLAARSGDAATVLSLIDGATDPYAREFLLEATLWGINRAPWIENLPEQHPDDATAWLIRGAHSVLSAWQAVGNEYTPSSDATARSLCAERLEAADRDLVHASRLRDDDPTPWSYLVSTGYGLGLGFEETCNRFDEADKRAPWLHLAHHHMLQAARFSRSGSNQIMFAFARDVLVNAPDGSPCLDLIALAHLADWWDRRVDDPTLAPSTVLEVPAVRAEIEVAASRSVGMSAFDDRGDAVVTRNVFALVLLELGEHERARDQLVKIGDRPSALPWVYTADDPGLGVARARQRVGHPGQDW